MKQAKDNQEVFDLSVFESGDGAHCGLADWYPEKEEALKAALDSGLQFDTGWYASKKEIASARISGDHARIRIEVSVSDDFDTEGYAADTISAPATLGDIANAIYRVWDEAEAAQKDNRQYAGYSLIHYSAKIPEWQRSPNVFPQETRKRYPHKVARCLDYFIAPAGDGDIMESPPGDNYSHWYWQNDPEGEGRNCTEDGIPKRTVKRFEEFAKAGNSGSLRIGDWEIKAWDGEEN